MRRGGRSLGLERLATAPTAVAVTALLLLLRAGWSWLMMMPMETMQILLRSGPRWRTSTGSAAA
jgi:hypothetical protein